MTIPESSIKEVRARADIVDVISSCGIDLRRAGSDFVALCPFHNEKTPSFHVHPTTGYYKCFGCGKHGDPIDFLQEYRGMSFSDAVTTLADRYGIALKKQEDPQYKHRKQLYSLLSDVCSFYARCLASMKEAGSARDYLVKRGLANQVQQDFNIGYAPKDNDVIVRWAQKYNYSIQDLADAGIVKLPENGADGFAYHRFAGRLMFAIKDSAGRVVGFSGRQLVANKRQGKYVNSPETEVFKKGNVLYGLYKAAPNITKSPRHEIILCEGQIDCIRLHTTGFPIAVAPQGTAFTAEHAAMVKRYADSAVLVFDDDAAGHKATIKAACLLLAQGLPVRVISLPDGDDPDSYLSSQDPSKGAPGFQKLLDNAESVISFQCRSLRQEEPNPDSADAMTRITKSMLKTIACCSNMVLKDVLLSEMAKVMGISKDILQEEVVRTKIKPLPTPQKNPAPGPSAPQGEEGPETDSEDESDVHNGFEDIGPSPVESILLSFLACYEGNEKVKGWLESAMSKAPQLKDKFTSPFVPKFISAFLSPTQLPLSQFAETLSMDERAWFDQILSKAIVSSSMFYDTFDPLTILRDLLVVILKRAV